MIRALIAALMLLAAPAFAQEVAPAPPVPEKVWRTETVRLETAQGPILIALEVERAPETVVGVFRDSIRANDGAYDICVIDTPPALGMRTFAGLLAADAVLAPIGVNDYSLAGITELMRAIKGVATHYKREEPRFLGLLPSLFDRKSKRERELFEQLAGQLGKVLFPGMVAKRDSYAKAGSEGIPV